MAIPAYQGHESYGSSAQVAVVDADNPLAPADRANYDPTDFTAQPGAAARANKYPRQDGK